LDGEPRLEITSIVLSLLQSTFPIQHKLNFSIEDGVKERADLAVQMANDLIIDFTFVGPYNKTGQAALKGMFSATTSQINST